jgi:hypothetical protein
MNPNPVFPNGRLAHQQAGQGAFAQGHGPVANAQAGQGAFAEGYVTFAEGNEPFAAAVVQSTGIYASQIPRAVPIGNVGALVDHPDLDAIITDGQPLEDPIFMFSNSVNRGLDSASTVASNVGRGASRRASYVRRVASQRVSNATRGIRSRYDRHTAAREINSLIRDQSFDEAWDLLDTHRDNAVFTEAQFDQINTRIIQADNQLFQERSTQNVRDINLRLQQARRQPYEMGMRMVDAERNHFEIHGEDIYNEQGRTVVEMLLEGAENRLRDMRPR